MGTIYKTSRSNVIVSSANQRYIYMVEAENPELKIADYLRNFLVTLGYSEIYPNFDNIRIGTIHPFAILLAQEVTGTGTVDSNDVFPSVTVADSNIDEDAEVISNNYGEAVLDAEKIEWLNGLRQAKELFVSDDGWTSIKNALTSKGYVIGIEKQYHTSHMIDFNIWTENKEVTSFLFDTVCHFITQKRNDIHNELGYDFAKLGGRRSGDINLDYGRILYGANVSLSMSMNHRAWLIDTNVSTIGDIDTQTLPNYFVLKGV